MILYQHHPVGGANFSTLRDGEFDSPLGTTWQPFEIFEGVGIADLFLPDFSGETSILKFIHTCGSKNTGIFRQK